jgi:hypothetical protein
MYGEVEAKLQAFLTWTLGEFSFTAIPPYRRTGAEDHRANKRIDWMYAIQSCPWWSCCCSTCCTAPCRRSRRAIAPVVRLERGHITRHLPPGRTWDVSQTRSPNHTHSLCTLAALKCTKKRLPAVIRCQRPQGYGKHRQFHPRHRSKLQTNPVIISADIPTTQVRNIHLHTGIVTIIITGWYSKNRSQ